jgi:fermentation-respiration switch protein FrsA (DUF1100 family)
MSDGRAAWLLKRITPHELGLVYLTREWTVRDQRTGRRIKIAGWWIPAEGTADKTAVLIHGYGDAKVGGIAWAPLLRELGFNVLAIDLRAHGQSEGRFSTAGCWERFDITQVLDQELAERPEAMRRIVVLGVSLGAAVTAGVAEMRDDLSAAILECPYSSYRRAIGSHAERSGMPGRSFQTAAVWLAERIARADFDALAPVRTIGRMRCPVMVIQSGDDPLVTENDAAEIEAAVRSRPAEAGPNVFWPVPEARHVMAMNSFPDDYREQVGAFLAAALSRRENMAGAAGQVAIGKE